MNEGKSEKPKSAGAENQAVGTDAATAVFEDLEALRERIAGLEQERDDFRNLLQRTRADFENYQKRSQRDSAQERRYAHGALALDILPILDNFERAVAAAKQAGESGPLVQGVSLIQNQVMDALKRNGITRMEAEGQPFNPNLHQAVMQQPAAEQPPNTVLKVLEQGFMLHDRVLRPASVVVSVPAPAAGGQGVAK
ncbi:MAG TPA: nucleotide exchange factor GrpE [Gemmataceae bacterium]|nr:nucleotide exchange factor GrpE [Gemmataceae bacterium]